MKKRLVLSVLLAVCFSALEAVDLIKDGKIAFDAVVLSPRAFPMMKTAAEELVYHLKLATGETLPVITDDKVKKDGKYIFLGSCRQNFKLNIKKMDVNCGVIEIGKNHIKITGKDGRRKVTSNNSNGTLFATYEFLEKFLGVRWIWPGKSGEIVPEHKNLALKEQTVEVKAQLKSSCWRMSGQRPETWKSKEYQKRFMNDYRVWMRRHRFCSFSIYFNGHAFGKYYQRYGKTNPEFFSLLPDGTRRPNPYMWSRGNPRDVSMCVTSPGLVKTIVQNYLAGKRNTMININENDTSGECVCAACLKADNSLVPDAERLKKAKELFDRKKSTWVIPLGSLSDRYCRFFLEVQKEADKHLKDPVIAGLIYANYSEPPSDKIKLNKRIHLRFCPPYMYPWTEKKINAYKKIWGGWAKTGAALMFRPNYTLDGNCFPVQYHEAFYDMYMFSAKNGMVAVDMDSCTGHSGAQGLVNYVIATLNHNRASSLEEMKDEFYSAFGAAKGKVREYFEYITYVTMKVPFKNPLGDPLTNEGGHLMWNMFLMADNIFTPQVMAKATGILNEAAAVPGLDKASAERVKFLQYALENVRLIMAAQVEFRKYKAGGPIAPFDKAVQEIDAFRASIEHTGAINVGHLRYLEDRHWRKNLPIKRFKRK